MKEAETDIRKDKTEKENPSKEIFLLRFWDIIAKLGALLTISSILFYFLGYRYYAGFFNTYGLAINIDQFPYFSFYLG